MAQSVSAGILYIQGCGFKSRLDYKYGLFEYRLVRQLFTLERGVRLPYRLQNYNA